MRKVTISEKNIITKSDQSSGKSVSISKVRKVAVLYEIGLKKKKIC